MRAAECIDRRAANLSALGGSWPPPRGGRPRGLGAGPEIGLSWARDAGGPVHHRVARVRADGSGQSPSGSGPHAARARAVARRGREAHGRAMTLLALQGVHKALGERELLRGVDLVLNEGERVGLVGANGSGKSTLLRILAGVEAPDAGERTARRGLRLGYLEQ